MSSATDERQLEEFGYKQELPRVLRFWTNWAIGFAFISPIVSLYTVVALGASTAGPPWVWSIPVVPWSQNYAFLIGIAAFGLLGLAYFLARRPDRRFALGGAAAPAAVPVAALHPARADVPKREPVQT